MQPLRPILARWLRPVLILFCMLFIVIAAPACDCSSATGDGYEPPG